MKFVIPSINRQKRKDKTKRKADLSDNKKRPNGENSQIPSPRIRGENNSRSRNPKIDKVSSITEFMKDIGETDSRPPKIVKKVTIDLDDKQKDTDDVQEEKEAKAIPEKAEDKEQEQLDEKRIDADDVREEKKAEAISEKGQYKEQEELHDNREDDKQKDADNVQEEKEAEAIPEKGEDKPPEGYIEPFELAVDPHKSLGLSINQNDEGKK